MRFSSQIFFSDKIHKELFRGVNLIGATEFRNKPQKALDVYQTLSLLEGGVWERD